MDSKSSRVITLTTGANSHMLDGRGGMKRRFGHAAVSNVRAHAERFTDASE